METKNRILKTAKICDVALKVFYCLDCVAYLTCIVLAIVLPRTNAVKAFTSTETAILFSAVALYAFMLLGLLWNAERIFASILKEQTPFCESVCHYLKKSGVFFLLCATVPAIVGTILLHSLTPATQLHFSVELGGIIAGIVLLLFAPFFGYGKELESRDRQ